MLKKLLDNIISQRSVDRRAELHRKLIRHEARLGGQLFGPVAAGGRREFFCLDRHTWVWHEEWLDKAGKRQTKTTRYDVRPNGILKAQNGYYQALTPTEARRLRDAMAAYHQRVHQELYAAVA